MKKTVLYVHGKGGSAAEAEHYKSLLPEQDIVGFDYRSCTPWEAEEEFPRLYDSICNSNDTVIVIANSIGAYFTMAGFGRRKIDRAFFISPIVDMEKLICDMMSWANVTENELQRRKEIPTSFGETLSWDYFCYVRKHPVKWDVPTEVLYGSEDNLTSFETISAFVKTHKASLTVMENGEHWFHTDAQMSFLDEWIKRLF